MCGNDCKQDPQYRRQRHAKHDCPLAQFGGEPRSRHADHKSIVARQDNVGENDLPNIGNGLEIHTASPSTKSEAFSPIMMAGALVLPDVITGMIDASATRNPLMPRTFSFSSTTAILSCPILQVPVG